MQIARKTGAYADLHKVDLQKPLPFGDNEFDAVNCIGVLTYIEGIFLLHEFCRIVSPGGHIVFSQRDDMFYERDYAAKLRDMVESGLWKQRFKSKPKPYLPKNADYGENIKVQYFVYEVCG